MCRSKILFTRIDRRDWEHDSSHLPAALRERISKFKQRRDRAARMAAYALLSKALLAVTGKQAALEPFIYSSTGRPSLRAFPSIDFNLSHSGDYALCGVLGGGRIGVDIERVESIDLEEGRAAFSAVAWQRIIESPQPREAFYRAWTRMEAVAKAEGFGIAGPVKSFCDKDTYFTCGERSWHVLEVLIAGYSCHIASSRPLSLADVDEVI